MQHDTAEKGEVQILIERTRAEANTFQKDAQSEAAGQRPTHPPLARSELQRGHLHAPVCVCACMRAEYQHMGTQSHHQQGAKGEGPASPPVRCASSQAESSASPLSLQLFWWCCTFLAKCCRMRGPYPIFIPETWLYDGYVLSETARQVARNRVWHL